MKTPADPAGSAGGLGRYIPYFPAYLYRKLPAYLIKAVLLACHAFVHPGDEVFG